MALRSHSVCGGDQNVERLGFRIGLGMSRYFGWFTSDDSGGPDTDHLKDSDHIVFLFGYCVPLAFYTIAIVNICLGRVYLPYDRFPGDALWGLSQSYTKAWHVCGVVAMKIGMGSAFFSWYALANYERTERWAQLALLLSIIVIALGLIATSIGYFA